MAALLGVVTTENSTTTISPVTNGTTIGNIPSNSPPPPNPEQTTSTKSVQETKVDKSKQKSPYECWITRRLYDNSIAAKGDEFKKRICAEPGCFYIYEQENLGWDFPEFLVENKKRGKRLYLTGCRHDIPYLLERSKGKERIHRAIRALRACYVGTRMDAGETKYCQPEYEGEGQISLNQGMDKVIRKDNFRDTWAGRFIPSTQNRCFIEFLYGVFYVNDNGKGLVVCCSNGTSTTTETDLFKSHCQTVTVGIDSLDWRKDVDN
uniref:ApeC domain-containing protein n=1 Tax=Meloidogyne hapla TaxID=6305 RepID=A0A1I8B7I9_MELHA